MAEIVMYTAPWCGWCERAKGLLARHGYRGITEIDIEAQGEGAWAELERRTGQKSVPQIFIGDRHVGGFQDLAALIEEGRLDALAGA